MLERGHTATRPDSDYHLGGSKLQASRYRRNFVHDAAPGLLPENNTRGVVKNVKYTLIQVGIVSNYMDRVILREIFRA